jgi:hypothetical protein
MNRSQSVSVCTLLVIVLERRRRGGRSHHQDDSGRRPVQPHRCPDGGQLAGLSGDQAGRRLQHGEPGHLQRGAVQDPDTDRAPGTDDGLQPLGDHRRGATPIDLPPDIPDTDQLPPRHVVLGARRDADGWRLPPLAPRPASTSASLHLGPILVAFEAEAMEAATSGAGTTALQAEGWDALSPRRARSARSWSALTPGRGLLRRGYAHVRPPSYPIAGSSSAGSFARLRHTGRPMVFISRYSSKPCPPLRLPRPLCL